MPEDPTPLGASRRSFIAAGGAGFAWLAGSPAHAQAPVPIWSGEYTARKGAVSLAMYRKRLTDGSKR